MRKIFSESNATNALLALLSAVIIFHFLVLFNILPSEIIWGGRIENQSGVLQMEIILVAINLTMILIVKIKKGLIKSSLKKKYLHAAFWIMFIFFVLNTLRNILSLNEFEKFVFAPFTFILSFLSLRLALSK